VWSILPPEQEFVLERILNELRLQAACLGRQASSSVEEEEPSKKREDDPRADDESEEKC
jgi:hypothetical protein